MFVAADLQPALPLRAALEPSCMETAFKCRDWQWGQIRARYRTPAGVVTHANSSVEIFKLIPAEGHLPALARVCERW